MCSDKLLHPFIAILIHILTFPFSLSTQASAKECAAILFSLNVLIPEMVKFILFLPILVTL